MADPLDALRKLMASQSPPLDALIVPSEDNHQSEYVSSRDKRREFVSKFTGSAGLALVTMNEALLWTDGRYFLQATQQLSERWKLMRIGEDPSVETWIADNIPNEGTVGIDPWCISVETAQRWEHAFSKKKQKLIQLPTNLVDEVWTDRPPVDIQPVRIHPLEFTGRSVADKLKDLREKLLQDKAYGIIITSLDEVAWLYNIRGNDVAYCPVVHAYAIVTVDSSFFYVDKRKVNSEVQSYMVENGIAVREYNAVDSDVSLLSSGQLIGSDARKEAQNEVQKAMGNGRIWIDSASCCLALYSKLASDQVLMQQSPLALAKAIKNPTELDGLRKAHIRDGAAVVQYLVWLDSQSFNSKALLCDAHTYRLAYGIYLHRNHPTFGHHTFINSHIIPFSCQQPPSDTTEVNFENIARPQYLMQEVYGASGYFVESEGTHKRKYSETQKLTEVSVSDKLEAFRAKQENFKGLSFPTISSVGPNAAVIHYSPDLKSCSELDADSIYLFDSGAQYLDGTTDITRTVHFGKPSAHEKACYTAVLKGHIALDVARFPNGTTGHCLDILARIPLWKDGLDYRHGTGHGIGSYLNVHEGPHLISFKPLARNVPLQSSMTVTDEPGYYEDGNFGIRLENVLIVKEADTKFNFGDKGYLAFEHITWAPYQRKLMDLKSMTGEEIEWVDSYHATCRETLAPYLDEQEIGWLRKATEPILVAA